MGSSTEQHVRQSERVQIRLPVGLRVSSDQRQVSHLAFTSDLSNAGARIRTNAGLIPGQVVTIIADEDNQCLIPGLVAWVGPVGSRLERQAGIEFLYPISLSS